MNWRERQQMGRLWDHLLFPRRIMLGVGDLETPPEAVGWLPPMSLWVTPPEAPTEQPRQSGGPS